MQKIKKYEGLEELLKLEAPKISLCVTGDKPAHATIEGVFMAEASIDGYITLLVVVKEDLTNFFKVVEFTTGATVQRTRNDSDYPMSMRGVKYDQIVNVLKVEAQKVLGTDDIVNTLRRAIGRLQHVRGHARINAIPYNVRRYIEQQFKCAAPSDNIDAMF